MHAWNPLTYPPGASDIDVNDASVWTTTAVLPEDLHKVHRITDKGDVGDVDMMLQSRIWYARENWVVVVYQLYTVGEPAVHRWPKVDTGIVGVPACWNRHWGDT